MRDLSSQVRRDTKLDLVRQPINKRKYRFDEPVPLCTDENAAHTRRVHSQIDRHSSALVFVDQNPVGGKLDRQRDGLGFTDVKLRAKPSHVLRIGRSLHRDEGKLSDVNGRSWSARM